MQADTCASCCAFLFLNTQPQAVTYHHSDFIAVFVPGTLLLTPVGDIGAFDSVVLHMNTMDDLQVCLPPYFGALLRVVDWCPVLHACFWLQVLEGTTLKILQQVQNLREVTRKV